MISRSCAAIFGLAVLLVSCGSNETVNSTDVNEDKIFQRLHADYDEGSKTLSMFAQFTLGGDSGTTIRLLQPSGVSVDNVPMSVVDGDLNPINIMGTYYTQKFCFSIPGLGAKSVFRWTQNDGSVLTNQIEIAKPSRISSPASGSNLSKNDNLSVTISGAPPAVGEYLRIELSEDKNPTSDSAPVQVSKIITTGLTAEFNRNDLAQLSPGPAKLKVIRVVDSKPLEVKPEVGGVMQSSWRSPVISINVTD
jgi:hypothetical protein